MHQLSDSACLKLGVALCDACQSTEADLVGGADFSVGNASRERVKNRQFSFVVTRLLYRVRLVLFSPSGGSGLWGCRYDRGGIG